MSPGARSYTPPPVISVMTPYFSTTCSAVRNSAGMPSASPVGEPQEGAAEAVAEDGRVGARAHESRSRASRSKNRVW